MSESMKNPVFWKCMLLDKQTKNKLVHNLIQHMDGLLMVDMNMANLLKDIFDVKCSFRSPGQQETKFN